MRKQLSQRNGGIRALCPLIGNGARREEASLILLGNTHDSTLKIRIIRTICFVLNKSAVSFQQRVLPRRIKYRKAVFKLIGNDVLYCAHPLFKKRRNLRVNSVNARARLCKLCLLYTSRCV